MKKLGKYVAIGFALFLVATVPATAAALGEMGLTALGELASGAADMLTEWVS